MPKRTDINKILIIGSGPIIIGQACEFDYSGTQACKALRKLGYEGDMAVLLDAEAGGASITYAVKLTESDTSGGTYTDVTGGAFTTTTANTASLQKITVNVTSLKRFVKATATVAGGTGAGAVAADAGRLAGGQRPHL